MKKNYKLFKVVAIVKKPIAILIVFALLIQICIIPVGGIEWDISTASYFQSFSVAAQETSPTGVFFKPDGTKMYVLGYDGDEVNEYDLGVAWDVTSAVWLQLFSVAGEDTLPTGLFFKPDGSKMYVIGRIGIDVNEYDLGVAWDVSTAVWLQLFDVSPREAIPQGVFFKPDGLKMYVIGSTGNEVNEYDLGVAWDISTAVWLQLFDVLPQDTVPKDVFFKPDGLKMYVVGGIGKDVNEYDLGVAWDVTSAVWLQLFSVAGEEGNPSGVFFKPDGTKMYVVGRSGDDVNEYDLPPAADTTAPTYSGAGVNTTIAGAVANFYVQYNDDTALHTEGQYIFSTNNTGTWTNDSAVNFTATPEWVNVTKTLNSTADVVVGYRWFADDNTGKCNYTPIYTLTITAPPPPPITDINIHIIDILGHDILHYRNGSLIGSYEHHDHFIFKDDDVLFIKTTGMDILKSLEVTYGYGKNLYGFILILLVMITVMIVGCYLTWRKLK